jgi:hypothetical protein
MQYTPKEINKYQQRIPWFSDVVRSLVGIENAPIDHMPLTISWWGIWSHIAASVQQCGITSILPKMRFKYC